MNRRITLPGGFLLTSTAAYCTLCAVINGFKMPADTGVLFLTTLAASFIFTAVIFFRGGKALLLSLPVVFIFLIWKWAEILEGARWIVFRITTEYNKWLYVEILFPDSSLTGGDVTVFFIFFGIVLAYLLSIAINIHRSIFISVFITTPPVLLTFVLIQSQPNPWLLVGLIAVFFTLLIFEALHLSDPDTGNKIIYPAMLLVLLLFSIAYLIVPLGNYHRNDRTTAFSNLIKDTAGRMGLTNVKTGVGWPPVNEDGTWQFNTNIVRVSDAGHRVIADISLLDITATGEGTFYIKGFSMERFNGRDWLTGLTALTASQESNARYMPTYIAWAYGQFNPENPPVQGTMKIEKTGDATNVFYHPYYSDYIAPMRRPGNEYNIDYIYTEESILEMYRALPPHIINDSNISEYNEQMQLFNPMTRLDDETYAGLRRIAIEAGIDINAERAVIADMVAEFISSSARYTLNPYVIPQDEDFALYFLETSKQGYCIHFTTAAALMLRALDIPARFASGYVVTIPPGSTNRPISITDRHAHAWVEVYYENVGWLPLEVTPATPESGIPAARSHTPSQYSPSDHDPYDDMPHEWDNEQDLNVSDVTPGQTGTTQPETGTGQGHGHILLRYLLYILYAAAPVVILITRRTVTLRYRNKGFAQSDTNAAVICVWRYIMKLTRKGSRSEDIENLALKARFSQHRISEEERAYMIEYATQLANKIYDHYTLPGQLWLRWGRAL